MCMRHTCTRALRGGRVSRLLGPCTFTTHPTSPKTQLGAPSPGRCSSAYPSIPWACVSPALAAYLRYPYEH